MRLNVAARRMASVSFVSANPPRMICSLKSQGKCIGDVFMGGLVASRSGPGDDQQEATEWA